MTVDRMKLAIQQEITKLSTHDEVLQSQTDSNAQAALTNALNLHKEAEERRKVRKVLDNEIQQRTEHDSQQDEQISENSINIETERQVRFAGEAGLAKQTASNAEANIQNALNLHEVSERRKEDLAREKQARIEHDKDLQLQADDLAEGLINAQVSNIKSNEQRKSDINREASIRAEHDENLQTQIDDVADASIKNALNAEREAQQRREKFAQTQRQIDAGKAYSDYLKSELDSMISSVFQEVVNLHQALERRRNALSREEKARSVSDEVLQEEIDTVSQAGINNALNIQEEANKRRQLLDRLLAEKKDMELQIQALREEIGQLYEIPLPGLREKFEALQEQSDELSTANSQNALNFLEGSRRLRADLSREKSIREAENKALQTQHNELAEGLIQGLLSLLDRYHRQKSDLQKETIIRSENDAGILEHIHLLSLAGTQAALNSQNAHERRRVETAQEAKTRSQHDESLQEQINDLADANIRLTMNGIEEHQRITADIKEIKQFLDRIYDALVDTGTVTYRGAKVATSHEISDMLSDVMSGSTDGAVSEAEIPEDLKDDIATHEEITEMLDEVFPQRS